jgi:MraZ protein
MGSCQFHYLFCRGRQIEQFALETMFLGEHKRAIDDKGQLSLPHRFSGILASGLIVTRGFDRNLMLFTHTRWQVLADQVLQRPLSSRQVRILRRHLFADAAILTPDHYGRIILPTSLRNFANLRAEVMLTGMGDYVEVWSAERWLLMRDEIESEEKAVQWEEVGI